MGDNIAGDSGEDHGLLAPRKLTLAPPALRENSTTYGTWGIDLRFLSVRRLMGHTHPWGYFEASPGDLRTLGIYPSPTRPQRTSSLLVLDPNGGIYDFFRFRRIDGRPVR